MECWPSRRRLSSLPVGIDLSVGTLMTFCAVIAGVALTYLGTAAVAGGRGGDCGGCTSVACVRARFVAKMKIPPFIATLGMMLILKGLVFGDLGDATHLLQ